METAREARILERIDNEDLEGLPKWNLFVVFFSPDHQRFVWVKAGRIVEIGPTRKNL
jgi:hypothetical protein